MTVANLPERLELVLGGAAVSLLIVFLGALRATLRREEGEAGALSATAVIGGSVLGGAALVALATDDVDELRRLLAFPAATTLAAASLGILATDALPRVLGYAGLAAAAVQVSAAFGLEEVGLAAFAAWAGAGTLAMVRQRGG